MYEPLYRYCVVDPNMELLFGTKNERAVTVNKNFIYNFRPVNLRQCRKKIEIETGR